MPDVGNALALTGSFLAIMALLGFPWYGIVVYFGLDWLVPTILFVLMATGIMMSMIGNTLSGDDEGSQEAVDEWEEENL